MDTLLTPESVFIDIGANQGEFTIAAASIASKGRVISFEPVSVHRQRLHANVSLNQYKNVEVLPYAVADVNGEMPIYDSLREHFFDGTHHEGLPTLYASPSRSMIHETVAVCRLDDVLAELHVTRVDVIKLDIEGAEYAALRGATNTLKTYNPIVIMEIGKETCLAAGYEPRELFEYLTSFGYRIEKIMEGGRTQIISSHDLQDFQNVVAYPVKAQSNDA